MPKHKQKMLHNYKVHQSIRLESKMMKFILILFGGMSLVINLFVEVFLLILKHYPLIKRMTLFSFRKTEFI